MKIKSPKKFFKNKKGVRTVSKSDRTIAHIKIKGNEGAVETMMRLRDVLRDEGVEITLEIKSSELRSKKIFDQEVKID